MRIWPVFFALLSVTAACKDDREQPRNPVPPSAPADPGSAPGDDVIRAGDDTPAGRTLATLARINPPALQGNPACEGYARSTSSIFIGLDQETDLASTRGARRDDLARLGASLAERARTLGTIGSSRLMDTGELSRLHRELSAAVADLSDSLIAAYGTAAAAADPTLAVRVENAAQNLVTTLAALESLCTRP